MEICADVVDLVGELVVGKPMLRLSPWQSLKGMLSLNNVMDKVFFNSMDIVLLVWSWGSWDACSVAEYQTLLAFELLIAWFHMLWRFRAISIVGPSLVPIFDCMSDLGTGDGENPLPTMIAIVVSFVLAAFFFCMVEWSASEIRFPVEPVYQNMIVGETVLVSEEDSWIRHAFVYSCFFIIAIFLMNVFIAVVTVTYECKVKLMLGSFMSTRNGIVTQALVQHHVVCGNCGNTPRVLQLGLLVAALTSGAIWLFSHSIGLAPHIEPMLLLATGSACLFLIKLSLLLTIDAKKDSPSFLWLATPKSISDDASEPSMDTSKPPAPYYPPRLKIKGCGEELVNGRWALIYSLDQDPVLMLRNTKPQYENVATPGMHMYWNAAHQEWRIFGFHYRRSKTLFRLRSAELMSPCRRWEAVEGKGDVPEIE